MSAPKNKTWADVAFELCGPIGIAIVILAFGGCVALGGSCQVKLSEPQPATEGGAK